MNGSSALKDQIEGLAQSAHVSRFAVAVRDFENGREFSLFAGQPFHAASTIKVAVLLALYRAIDAGEIEANDHLLVRNRFRSAVGDSYFQLKESSDGYGDLYRRIGRTEKIGRLAEWMIIWSSNLATNLLVDFLGVEQIRTTLQSAEVRGITFQRGVDDEHAFEAGINNEVTAEGLVELFAALRGNFLQPNSRDAVVHILLDQRFNAMIPAGLPKHANAAHKTGEISSACHDAGIVYLPEREPYLLAILTENRAAAESRRELVAKISAAVFRFINEK